jgi:hypothetical protein
MLVRHAEIRQETHRSAAPPALVSMDAEADAKVISDPRSRIAPLVAKSSPTSAVDRTALRYDRAQISPIFTVVMDVSAETNIIFAWLCGWLVCLSLLVEDKLITAQSLL